VRPESKNVWLGEMAQVRVQGRAPVNMIMKLRASQKVGFFHKLVVYKLLKNCSDPCKQLTQTSKNRIICFDSKEQGHTTSAFQWYLIHCNKGKRSISSCVSLGTMPSGHRATEKEYGNLNLSIRRALIAHFTSWPH